LTRRSQKPLDFFPSPLDIQNVKLTLVIVCSLLLAGTPLFPARAPAACVKRAAHAPCHCGGACCTAPASPESQPVPAVPVPTSSQNQLLTLAPAALVWTLPDVQAPLFLASSFSPLTATGAPLYARDCARLI